MRRLLLFGLAASLALGGCGWGRKKKPLSAPMPLLVGKVAVVNAPLKFVLVDVGSLYSPAEGLALKCFSGGQETAVLAVSLERKRPFIVGDIVKGMPGQGDLVYQ